jgi:hypothetical protein
VCKGPTVCVRDGLLREPAANANGTWQIVRLGVILYDDFEIKPLNKLQRSWVEIKLSVEFFCILDT